MEQNLQNSNELISETRKFTGFKINTQNQLDFYTPATDNQIKIKIPFIIIKIIFLEIYMTKDA